MVGCTYGTYPCAVAIKYGPLHSSALWDIHLPSRGTSEQHLCSGWLTWAGTTCPLSTLGSQLTDGDLLACWFWQSERISRSNFMPAGFDRLIYYLVFNYLWLYCSKNHLCLVSLPLEDHLWLTLLIAPRGSAGDFSEMLISTGPTWGFPWCFLVSPWKDVSPALVNVPAIRGEVTAIGWEFSPFLSQRRTPFSSVRPREPLQAWRSCEGLCAICFSHADLRSTAWQTWLC